MSMRNLINILNENAIDDQEGRMAKGQMANLIHDIHELDNMIENEDDLPEWCQAKITLAKDYIEKVKDYMMGHEATRK